MLGMRRPSSLDLVESERAPAKIPKEDALSIYEATLQKLRQGSRRAFGTSAESMKCERLPSAPSARPNCVDLPTNSKKQLEDNPDSA